MKNYLLAALVLGLFTMQSCKKETASTPFCKATYWGLTGQGFTLVYDEAGFIKKNTLTDGTYYEFTQTGSLLVRQRYNSAGVPMGSSETQVVNSLGYVTVAPRSSDTSFYSYNADGRLAEFTRRNDTIISRLVFNYRDGDLLNAVEYRQDSTVKTTIDFEYYTDRENHSNLNINYDLMDSRFGKPAKHFLKRITKGTNNVLSNTNIYYTFDEQGSATQAQVISQPDNYVSNLTFNYSCE